jgi:hypothetical protein
MKKMGVEFKLAAARRADGGERLLSPNSKARFMLLLTGWPRARLILDGVARHISGGFSTEQGQSIVAHAAAEALEAYDLSQGMDCCRFLAFIQAMLDASAEKLAGVGLKSPNGEWDASYPMSLSQWLGVVGMEDVELVADERVSAESVRERLFMVALEDHDRQFVEEVNCACQ